MNIFRHPSFREMLQSSFADPKPTRNDFLNIDVSSNSRMLASLTEFQKLHPHKYPMIEEMMKKFVTLTEGHWASTTITFKDIFVFVTMVYMAMSSLYFSREFYRDFRFISWALYFVGWIVFFGSFFWGANRYTVS
jgi:intracellular septation protein A